MSNNSPYGNYEGRPSKKKLSASSIIILLLILGAIGYGIYRFAPSVGYKLLEAVGYYDEDDAQATSLGG
jgi:hypothetical protein